MKPNQIYLTCKKNMLWLVTNIFHSSIHAEGPGTVRRQQRCDQHSHPGGATHHLMALRFTSQLQVQRV